MPAGLFAAKRVWQHSPGRRDVGRAAVTPRVLRHSRAVRLLQADVPLIYIRDFLGHSKLVITEIYVQCDTGTVRKAIERSNKVEVVVEEPVMDYLPPIPRLAIGSSSTSR